MGQSLCVSRSCLSWVTSLFSIVTSFWNKEKDLFKKKIINKVLKCCSDLKLNLRLVFVPEAACWSEWAPPLSSPTTSPKLFSFACISSQPLCFALRTSAVAHLDLRPRLACAAHHWGEESAMSVWAASAGLQVTSETRGANDKCYGDFDETESVCHHPATCVLRALRHLDNHPSPVGFSTSLLLKRGLLLVNKHLCIIWSSYLMPGNFPKNNICSLHAPLKPKLHVSGVNEWVSEWADSPSYPPC